MKKYILFFLLFGLSMFKLLDSLEGSDPINELVIQTSRNISEKYNLHFSGFGGATSDEGKWLVSIKFRHFGDSINISKARLLAINISEEFLKAINENEKIRTLLKVHPFTSNNIDITIIFFKNDMTTIMHPFLNTLSVYQGKIGYFTQDPDNQYKYKSEIYETYDEALAIVKGEKPDKNSKE